jgi:hypothetical protein
VTTLIAITDTHMTPACATISDPGEHIGTSAQFLQRYMAY